MCPLSCTSSVGAYSPAPDDQAVDESWPTHALPHAAYGREKSYVERVLDAFEREHSDVRVPRLRPGFIFVPEGAFNVAADPVLDAQTLGKLLGARPVKLPARPLRAAVAAAWRLHLVPASPMLVDLALSLPVMDTARIRSELGWTPSHTATEAIAEMLGGLREGEGGPTPPLEAQAGGRFREREAASGVGQRGDPDPGPLHGPRS